MEIMKNLRVNRAIVKIQRYVFQRLILCIEEVKKYKEKYE